MDQIYIYIHTIYVYLFNKKYKRKDIYMYRWKLFKQICYKLHTILELKDNLSFNI